MRSVAVLAAAALVSGCAHAATVRGRLDGLEEIVQQAEDNGAHHCAPRELAMARAHIRFGRIELEQGSIGRAESHFRIAEPNGRAAYALSPPERCLIQEEVEEPPPPPPPGDRDGDGHLDPDDACPDEAEDVDGFEDADGCPDAQDVDGDGVGDTEDMCPARPEDADGHEDEDGCPETDNDLDGLEDSVDRCPNEAEDPDGFSDDDGCPDLDNDGDQSPDATDRCPNEAGPPAEQGCPRVYENVEVTSTGIVIRQRVYFETNRDVIQPRSFELLDTVAQVLSDFPDITVEVQGHTDDRGSDSHNMELSQRRAEAVRVYLIRRGVAVERLTARGYGETLPIDSNRTPTGRAANRRVEFVRTDEAAQRSRAESAVP